MSVRAKLILIILFVAMAPLAVSAYSALRIHQGAFDAKVEELQHNAASTRARLTEQRIATAGRSLAAVARPIEWAQLSSEERTGALWLVYQQLDDAAVVQLIDQAGRGVGASVFADGRADPELQKHPQVSTALLQRFAKHLALAKKDIEFGQPFEHPGDGPPLVPVSIRVKGPAGKKWTLAVAVSLRGVCQEVSELVPAHHEVYMTDARGLLLCGTASKSTISNAISASRSAGGALVHFQADGVPVLAAVAPILEDWLVVAQQPETIASAAGQRIRAQTVFWLMTSLVVAIAAGLFLAREISKPLARLNDGAVALAGGDLGFRLDQVGEDEFGRLATAFNHMGEEIEHRDAEIRSWNESLQQRVEERTRDLKEAQSQLLQSQKIAAVSSLAAGVAHEINNPLTAVLGMAQLLSKRLAKKEGSEKDTKALGTIEREATRIGEIVKSLLNLARESSGEGGAAVELDGVLEQVIHLVENRASERGVEVERDYQQSALPVRGNSQQLEQALLHILNNALTACSRGERIKATISNVDGQLTRVEISDTGKGIPAELLDRVFEPFFTTKDDWQGRGLGLTVAHRIVDEHKGTIRLDSVEGEGTTVVMLLPVFQAESQLDKNREEV